MINAISSIHRYLIDPKYRFWKNAYLGLNAGMPDEEYLEKAFEYRMNRRLNLDNPKTFNEKLQWLKLYDHNSLYPQMVDKYDAKEYVGSIIGKEHIIPTIGVYDAFKDINFATLPNRFVLKCTHDSGGIYICKNKSEFSYHEAKKKINKSFRGNYYTIGREWAYRFVKPRILIEEYISGLGDNGVIDYKIHCFNGKPRIVLVCQDRFSPGGLTEDFFTDGWEHIDVRRPRHGNAKKEIDKPKELTQMLDIASALSREIPFVRVDLYNVSGKIFFGELTFFPANGFEPFVPDSFDYEMGRMLTLPVIDKG